MWVQIASSNEAIFRGKGMSVCDRRHSGVSYAKTAEPIEMPFFMDSRVGRRKHVLHGDTLAQPGEYD